MSRKKAWRLAGLNHLLKRDGHPSLLSRVRGEMFCCKFRCNLHCGLWSAGGECSVFLKSSSCHEAVGACKELGTQGSHRVYRGEGTELTRVLQVCHRCGACSASPELCSLYARIMVWWLLFLIHSPGFISLTDFTQELLPVVRRQPGGISMWYWEILMSLVPVGPLSIMSREGGRRGEVRKPHLQSWWLPSPLTSSAGRCHCNKCFDRLFQLYRLCHFLLSFCGWIVLLVLLVFSYCVAVSGIFYGIWNICFLLIP